MSKLNNIEGNPSKLRQWADANSSVMGKSTQKIKCKYEQLSDHNLWLITRFGAYSIDDQKWPDYSDDYAVFEWAAYVFSRILAWSEEHKTNEDQEIIPGYLIELFMRRFEKETGISGTREFLEDRFLLYGFYDGYAQHSGRKQSTPDCLGKLIYHSSTTHSLRRYDRNDPIFDISVPIDIDIAISASERCISEILAWLKGAYMATNSDNKRYISEILALIKDTNGS